eukprot:scaffold27244_cov51-Isochrysis_galbana.AAC.1
MGRLCTCRSTLNLRGHPGCRDFPCPSVSAGSQGCRDFPCPSVSAGSQGDRTPHTHTPPAAWLCRAT